MSRSGRVPEARDHGRKLTRVLLSPAAPASVSTFATGFSHPLAVAVDAQEGSSWPITVAASSTGSRNFEGARALPRRRRAVHRARGRLSACSSRGSGGFLLLVVWIIPADACGGSSDELGRRDLEPYAIQHFGVKVAFVPLVIGSYSPDLLSKWFVYRINVLGVKFKADDPCGLPRLANSASHRLAWLRTDRCAHLADLRQPHLGLELPLGTLGPRPDGRGRHDRDDALLSSSRPRPSASAPGRMPAQPATG